MLSDNILHNKNAMKEILLVMSEVVTNWLKIGVGKNLFHVLSLIFIQKNFSINIHRHKCICMDFL